MIQIRSIALSIEGRKKIFPIKKDGDRNSLKKVNVWHGMRSSINL